MLPAKPQFIVPGSQFSVLSSQFIASGFKFLVFSFRIGNDCVSITCSRFIVSGSMFYVIKGDYLPPLILHLSITFCFPEVLMHFLVLTMFYTAAIKAHPLLNTFYRKVKMTHQ
jgi:hypothetical protein